MNKELLNKANNLMHDIETIEKVIDERDSYYSCRFMDELAEWMKKKREEYQKEFEQLK